MKRIAQKELLWQMKFAGNTVVAVASSMKYERRVNNMEQLTREKRQLCDIQGRLFELALKNGLDCLLFIESFMTSKTAAALDDIYDRLQWTGEEYILEELDDEVNGLKEIHNINAQIAAGVRKE